MTRTAVHQLLPVLSPRDAIGAAVLGIRRMLRETGFHSEIFADLIGSDLRRDARPAGELEAAVRPGDCVVYHLSIGSPLADLVRRLPCRRAIYYHNITPEAFYAGTNAAVVYWLRRGREDLGALAPIADVCMAPSRYSLDELDEAGARTSHLVRLPIDLERFDPRSATFPQTPATVLFVGRIAPNKRQDELIRYLAALRSLDVPDVQLRLVGSYADTDRYMLGLQRFAEELGVRSSVRMTGLITDRELGEAYAGASVFACASLHEGFCVPLVEAMSFGLPVVARSAGAVPETLGGAGLLLDTDDPLVWASSIRQVLENPVLRTALADLGRQRVAGLMGEPIAPALAQSLADASVVA